MDGSWGNMEDECIRLKHNSWNVTCFRGLSYLGIEMYVKPPIVTWHVLAGGRFQGSNFEAHVSWCTIFNRSKQAPSYVETNNAFMICWNKVAILNNIGRCYMYTKVAKGSNKILSQFKNKHLLMLFAFRQWL
jgi:hypothetical protein